MKKNDARSGTMNFLLGSIRNYVKKNYPVLLLITITLGIVVAICFAKVATSATISSFRLEEYEVGQVSDITLRASKTIPPDIDDPVSIERGECVIKKGFPITEEGFKKLRKMADSPMYLDKRAFANSIIYHILMCALFFFLSSSRYFNNKPLEFRELVTECVFYLIVFGLAVLGTKTPGLSSSFSLCAAIPSSLFVFLVAILFGQLNAVFFALLISLNVLNAVSFQLIPFLFVLSTSCAAARIVLKIERRSDLVFASILQAMVNVVFLLVYKIIFNETMDDILKNIGLVALNGFFSGILCLGLLTPLEIILNTASPFRLMDLSDLNNPFMKKMLLIASGTYNHSLMVASLSEAACFEIGANALLARVGAYYHDIGKMDNPEYFVENQIAGENAHDSINPSLSVSVIRSHVKRGVEKARSLHLPRQILDIISEHHGNQVIAYFYNEAKQKNPDASPEDYSYTGVPPTTKESAIVMLADTVEAACRTLEKPSVPRLDKFIWTLINAKIEHHQLENCALTYSDIRKVHDSFVQILAGYYHSRTKYPDQKDPDGKAEEQKDSEEKNVSEAKSESKTESKAETKAEAPEKPEKPEKAEKDSSRILKKEKDRTLLLSEEESEKLMAELSAEKTPAEKGKKSLKEKAEKAKEKAVRTRTKKEAE